MERNPLNLWYDQNLQNLVVQTNTTWSESSVVTPTMFRNDEYLLKLQVYSDSSTTPATQANLTGINTSSWVLDIGSFGASPVITRSSADFNTDPWANTNVGQITCLVNTHSTALTSAIGTKTLKEYLMQITAEDNSVGNTQNICVFKVIINNVVGTGS